MSRCPSKQSSAGVSFLSTRRGTGAVYGAPKAGREEASASLSKNFSERSAIYRLERIRGTLPVAGPGRSWGSAESVVTEPRADYPAYMKKLLGELV